MINLVFLGKKKRFGLDVDGAEGGAGQQTGADLAPHEAVLGDEEAAHAGDQDRDGGKQHRVQRPAPLVVPLLEVPCRHEAEAVKCARNAHNMSGHPLLGFLDTQAVSS